MTRHPSTEGNELQPADVIIPNPAGDGRVSLKNDLAAEFGGLAISSTEPSNIQDGGLWVNLSADPTGIDRLTTYDESTDAFIPVSAESTIISEEQPEPEIGLLWFEPVEFGTNLYAASSDAWEFLQFIPATSEFPTAYGGFDDNTYVHDGSPVQTLTESGGGVEGVALSDSHVAYGGSDANTYVHDVSDGSLVHTLTESGGTVQDVDLSDAHVAYVTGGFNLDDNTYVHDVSDGSLIHTLTESGDRVQGVTLSDSNVAYGGDDENTYVHDVSDGSLIHTFTKSEDTVRAVSLL